MKKVPLHGKYGDGKYALVSDEDYELVMQRKWYVDFDEETPNCSYVYSQVGRKGLRLHQLIIGKKEGLVIDHINRNVLDNRRENLRHTTYRENTINRTINDKKWGASKFLGVCIHKSGKWQAQARHNSKSHYFGLFKTEEEAHNAFVTGCKRIGKNI